MNTPSNKNYLIQSQIFNETVLSDISEIQKDIIYYLQSIINFREANPTGEVYFDYNDFLKYKKTSKNLSYSPKEIQNFCRELIDLNGVIYNKKTENIEFFNIIDKIQVSNKDPENFTVYFASWGKIFFYEKFAIEYAELSKIQYTQIEKNIIDLQSAKRKKFFELLSQFKETGLYRISLIKLKTLLGFIIYDYSDTPEIEPKQLSLFDQRREPVKEFLKTWYDFRKVFLDPAIEEINSNKSLDISNVTYVMIKKGTKVVSLEFTFKRRLKNASLSEKEQKVVSYLKNYGLNDSQALFLLQRLTPETIYKRLSDSITFNSHYSDEKSKNYQRKVWFENETGTEIQNLGGFLYSKVFTELNENSSQ